MKHSKILWFIAIPILVIVLVAAALPSVLNAAGLNPAYSGPKYTAPGKRALIVATSVGTLGGTGKPTGVYASELTVPYYAFLDGGMAVDVASVKGGAIPVEPISLRWPLRTSADERFLKDADLSSKVARSLKIDDIDFASYDAVFLAGGWGAAYDLGYSLVLGDKLTTAFAKGVPLGSVCHGALGFLKARDGSGAPLVAGRKMTAVTDKQVRELGISITPLHPERELRAAGARYESESAFRDILASHVAVDGSLVTGQNQNDGEKVAQLLMKLAADRGLK